jgi:hypothetical protein
MEREPGPRDWTPSPSVDDWPPTKIRTRTSYSEAEPWSADGYASTRPRRRTARGYGWISLLLGTATLIFAMLGMLSAQTNHAIGISGAGVLAVSFGVAALRAHANERLVARAGITFGVLSVAAMAWSVVSLMLVSNGVVLPNVAFFDRLGASEEAITNTEYILDDAPQPVSTMDTDTGTALTFPDAEAEWDGISMLLGTAAYTTLPSADGLWPIALAVTTDGQTLLAPDGTALVAIPSGATVEYAVSPDRSSYVLTVTASQYGTIGRYDSSTRTISLSQ